MVEADSFEVALPQKGICWQPAKLVAGCKACFCLR